MLFFGRENNIFFDNRRLRFLTGLFGSNHYGHQVRMNRLWRICAGKLDSAKTILEAGAYKADFSFRAVTDKQCIADMVELDRQLCKQIERKFAGIAHQLFCRDIESFEPASRYDYIFLVDVSQYLYSPSATILRLLSYTNKSGCLFFTLPDIAADTNQGFSYEVVKNTEKRADILAAIEQHEGYRLRAESIYSRLDEKLEAIHKKIKSFNFALALICLPLLLSFGLLRKKGSTKVYIAEHVG